MILTPSLTKSSPAEGRMTREGKNIYRLPPSREYGFRNMRYHTHLLFVLSLILCLAGLSPAEEEAKENKVGLSGDVSAGFSLARGNTDTTNISISFSAKRKMSEKIEWLSTGFFLLGRVDGQTQAESLGLGSRVNWQHSERFFSYFELQGLRDRFKNYEYRVLPSVGVGVNILMKEKVSLSASTGISEVFTKYLDSGLSDSYTGLAVGNQFAWKISKTAELSQMLTINSDISELKNYFARFEINLAAMIAAGWAVKLTFIDNFDNNPVGEGIKKNDLAFLAGLSKKF